jgi:hypothetical protein
VILGLTKSKKWLILPIIASTFLFQYAIQGWCPPVYLLRRFGFRTRQEINLEIYALKVLRGDFDEILPEENGHEHKHERAHKHEHEHKHEREHNHEHVHKHGHEHKHEHEHGV